MRTWNANVASVASRFAKISATLATLLLLTAAARWPNLRRVASGSELPDLSSVSFSGSMGIAADDRLLSASSVWASACLFTCG